MTKILFPQKFHHPGGRRRAAMRAAAFLALLLVAAGPALGDGPPRFNWRMATLAPEGVGYAVLFKHLIMPKLEEVSHGDIKLKIFWSGVMGDDTGIIRKMRFGHLNGAGLTGSGAMTLCPEMSILSLPFMFKDYQEVDFVKSKMREDFGRYMMQSDAFLFALIDQGFDQTYSTQYDFTQPSHFKSARFLSWFGPMEEEFFKELGNNPIPVSFPRVLPSLQEDMGDSIMGPAVLVVGSTMFTMFKYVNPSHIRYSPAACVIRMDDWNSLPPEYVAEYHELRDGIEKEACIQIRRDSKKYLIALKKYGISVAETPPRTLAELKQKILPMWRRLEGKVYPPEVLEQVLAHLEEYRALDTAAQ